MSNRTCPCGRAHANRDYCLTTFLHLTEQIASHGLTLDECRAMLERQDGRCAISDPLTGGHFLRRAIDYLKL